MTAVTERLKSLFKSINHLYIRIPIKLRKRLLIPLELCLILILSFLIYSWITPKGASAVWFDDTFQYRKEFEVTNTGSELNDFQIRLTLNTSSLISANKMQTDCDDIRFADASGRSLSYWIETETYTCNTTTTRIWVKVSSIAVGSSKIYLYYGNQKANSATNGDNTFIFYDDFNRSDSGTVGPKWTEAAGASLWSISSNDLRYVDFNGPTYNKYYVETNQDVISENTVVDVDVSWTDNRPDYETLHITRSQPGMTSGNAGYMGFADWNGYRRVFYRNEGSFNAVNENSTGYFLTSGAIGYGSQQSVSIAFLPSQTKYSVNGGAYTTHSTLNSSFSPTKLYLTMYTYTDTGTTATANFDNVKVRKYAATEPTIASELNNEEKTKTPVAYWKFDEGQGSTINDSTQNRNIGSLSTGINAGDGVDGAITVSADKNINIDNMIGGRSCTNGGDAVNYAITSNVSSGATGVTLSYTPAAGCLNVGDEVLIINLQGSAGNNSNVGQYETKTISAINTATLTFDSALTNSYDGTTQKIIVQRVPNYTNVTVDSGQTLTVNNWNGTGGGVMFFRATGTVAVTGTISTRGKGYRASTQVHTSGEGINGTTVGNGSFVTSKGGARSIGQTTADAQMTSNWGHEADVDLSVAATNLSRSDSSKLIFGGGGGSGNQEYSTNAVTGGTGGGIIAISGNIISVTGSVDARGTDGNDDLNGNSAPYNGRGSGGAGGTIKLGASTLSLGSSLVTAQAGLSGRSWFYYWYAGNLSYAQTYAGRGAIFLDYNTLSGTTNQNDLPNWLSESQCINGSCLRFDGHDDRVSISDNNTLDFTSSNDFTLVAWVKHSGTISTNPDYIVSKADTASGGYKVYMDSSANLCFGIDDDSTWGPDDSACSSGTRYDDNKWHYISAVKNGTSRIEIYVDGVLKGSDTSISATSTLSNTNTLYIGSDRDTTNPWEGFIDEVKIYNYARTSTQLAADNNAKANPTGASAVLGVANNRTYTDGLVAYYKMDETSGDLGDASGNGNTGYTNGSSTTGGKFGAARSFNASSDYIEIRDSSLMRPTDTMSVSMWCNVTALNTNRCYVSKYAGNFGYSFYLGNDNKFYFLASNGTFGGYSASSTAITSTGWYHIVGTHDAKSHKIYVNGAEASSVAGGTLTQSTTHLWIGRNTNSTSTYYAGVLDELRFYNRALSGSEITQLYNFTQGPVAYWRMDEVSWNATANEVKDSSGNGINGTGANGANTVFAKYDRGGSFDGSNDYISLPSTTLLRPNYVSVGAWIKLNSNLSTTAMIFDNQSSNPWYGYALAINSSHKVSMDVKATNAVQTATGSTALSVGTWYYVAGTYDGTTMRVYVNGVQEGSSTAQTGVVDYTSTVSPTIGARSPSGSSVHFPGNIDELKVYNYARTNKQIVEDMNAGHPGVGSPIASALGHWRFDEGYGQFTQNSGSQGQILKGTFGANSGSSTDDPSWTGTGKFNRALKFDGGDYVNLGDQNSMEGLSEMTISMWVNASDPSLNRMLFTKENNAYTDIVYQLSLESSKFRIGVTNSTGSMNAFRSGATTLSANTWYHVTAVFKGGTPSLDLYVNGKIDNGTLTGTVPSQIRSNSIGILIGADSADTPSNFFTGSIDEVKFYNYALTSSEVSTEYNQGQSQVLGSLSDTTSGNQPQAANSEYCIPGDSTTCSPPIMRWDFEEKTGTGVFDKSGNSNHGTWNGSLGNQWTTTSKGDGAGSFNGSNNYISVSDSDSLDMTNNWTVQSWVKFNSFYTGACQANMLITKDADTATGSYSLYVQDTGGCGAATGLKRAGFAAKFTDGTASTVQGTTNLNTNTWYHLVGIYDGSNMKIYVNGKLENTTAVPGETVYNNSLPLRIGASNSGGWPYWLNGQIDQVRIYNYARTASQVSWDYNRGGPIAHFRFDECQGTSLKDSSGNGYTGAWNGTASGTNTGAGTCTSGTGSWFNGSGGKYNFSLHFDGTDDYVCNDSNRDGTCDSNTNLNPGTYLSTSAWVKLSDVSGVHYIITNLAGTPGDGFQMRTSPSNFLCNGQGIGNAAQGSTTISTGRWYHVTCTFNGTTTTLYVDGKQDAQTSSGTSVVSGTGILTIGSYSVNPVSAQSMKGQIDDVKLFNYTLTPSQVRDLYNSSAVRFGPSSGSP